MKRITLAQLSPYIGLRPFEEDDALAGPQLVPREIHGHRHDPTPRVALR